MVQYMSILVAFSVAGYLWSIPAERSKLGWCIRQKTVIIRDILGRLQWVKLLLITQRRSWPSGSHWGCVGSIFPVILSLNHLLLATIILLAHSIHILWLRPLVHSLVLARLRHWWRPPIVPRCIVSISFHHNLVLHLSHLDQMRHGSLSFLPIMRTLSTFTLLLLLLSVIPRSKEVLLNELLLLVLSWLMKCSCAGLLLLLLRPIFLVHLKFS